MAVEKILCNPSATTPFNITIQHKIYLKKKLHFSKR